MSVFQDTACACLFPASRKLVARGVGMSRESTPRTAKFLTAALLVFLAVAVPAASAPLRFGVFPQLSSRAIADAYQPLADHLGESIGHPVGLESAKDYSTFHERTLTGEYDVVLTAPHMAWLAWKEGGYRPVLIYEEPAKGFVVVRADSAYHKLGDLRDKTIAIPDPNAVANIRLARMLEKSGLSPGRRLTVAEVGTHGNAATHVSENQADAAVVGVYPFFQLSKAVRDKLRIIAGTPDLPGPVFLVHPRTTALREQEIRLAVEKFMHDEAGSVFLKKTGFGGVRALREAELRQVEGDALELKRRFQSQENAAGTAR